MTRRKLDAAAILAGAVATVRARNAPAAPAKRPGRGVGRPAAPVARAGHPDATAGVVVTLALRLVNPLNNRQGWRASTRVCDGVLLMHREDKHPTRDHTKDPPTPECVEIYSGKVRGVSRPVYVEAIARISEHRFVSRQTRDADVWTQETVDPRPSHVRVRSAAQGDGAAIYNAAGDLPDDGAPVFRGESGRLDLGPQWTDDDDDGRRGAA